MPWAPLLWTMGNKRSLDDWPGLMPIGLITPNWSKEVPCQGNPLSSCMQFCIKNGLDPFGPLTHGHFLSTQLDCFAFYHRDETSAIHFYLYLKDPASLRGELRSSFPIEPPQPLWVARMKTLAKLLSNTLE